MLYDENYIFTRVLFGTKGVWAPVALSPETLSEGPVTPNFHTYNVPHNCMNCEEEIREASNHCDGFVDTGLARRVFAVEKWHDAV